VPVAVPSLAEWPGTLPWELIRAGLPDHAAGVVLRDRVLDPAVSAVERDGFWEQLAGYGLRTVPKLISSGKVFAAARQLGRDIGDAPTGPWDDADVDDLSSPTVNEGLKLFARGGLARWDPSRGAALTTWFIGSCALVFPGVYRQWQRGREERGEWEVPLDAADAAGARSELGRRAVFGNPEALVVQRTAAEDALGRLGSPTDQQIMRMTVDGFSQQEIATALSLTVRAVEGRIYRIQQRPVVSSGREGENYA
jgi:DNA-directed RNA polymerase specialized sigma24 family protein